MMPPTRAPIPQLTDYNVVVNAIKNNPGSNVYLACGTDSKTADNIQKYNTAGGSQHPDQAAKPPSDKESQLQAKGNHGGKLGKQTPHMIEYTSDPAVSNRWARLAGCELLVEIQAKYLNLGSGPESGFTCYRNAPVRLIARYNVPDKDRISLFALGD